MRPELWTHIRRVALPAALITVGISGAGTGVSGAPSSADRLSRSPVYSTWDGATVLGRSVLVRTTHGISASLTTSDLPPGQAVTLWFGVVNNPSACATSPCTVADTANPDVRADFLWGGGHVVGGSGTGTFSGRLAVGDVSGSAFIEFGNAQAAVGLQDPWGAEVILLLHTHGPALSGQALKAQMTSFLGGCEVFLGGPDGFADGPGDIPANVGECTTFQLTSTHQ